MTRAFRRAPFLLVLLAGCVNTPPPAGPPRDAVLANAMTSARLAYERGLTTEAAALYGQALRRARHTDDAGAIADAAYNLAAALMEARDYGAARQALLESEAETRRGGGNVADVLLLRAKVARVTGSTTEAVALARRVLTDPASRPGATHRVQAHVLQGEVAAEAQDWAAAADHVRLAQAALGRTGDRVSPSLLATQVWLRGAIALRRGDWATAAPLHDRQADLLRQARRYADMAEALAESAQIWSRLGRPAEAATRFYRAARSWGAQGQIPRARSLLLDASKAARDAGDEQLLALIRALQSEWGDPETQPAPGPP